MPPGLAASHALSSQWHLQFDSMAYVTSKNSYITHSAGDSEPGASGCLYFQSL